MRVTLSRRAFGFLLVCMVLTTVLCVFAIPAGAVNLPDGRVFEQVTPVHMNGGRAYPNFVAPEGERVMYSSSNAFAGKSGGNTGAPYQAVRTSKGWQSYEMIPPASEYFFEAGLTALQLSEYSGDLSEQLAAFWGPFNSHLKFLEISHRYIQESAGGSQDVSPIHVFPLTVTGFEELQEGSSADFSHRYFYKLVNSYVSPLLESVEQGLPSGHVEEVGVVGPVNPEGIGTPASECGTWLGGDKGNSNNSTGKFSAGSHFHVISPTGSIVFMSAEGCPLGPGGVGPGRRELLARVDDTETIPISEPSLETCPGFFSGKYNFSCRAAEFIGASTDGSKAVFMSSQSEEVPGVTDTTENIYEAEIGGSPKHVTKMIQVSAGDTSGEGARVQGVVRMSDDGSHVYFVAQGVLTSAPGPEGDAAQNGADNLYVYDNGTTRFIGELCSGAAQSGAVADSHCFADETQSLWGPGKREEGGNGEEHGAWAAPFGYPTGDGHMLVFDSRAQLITGGPEADIDTAADVYKYDSQTGVLQRISTGRNGYDDNGNLSGFDATIGTPEYGAKGGQATSGSDTNFGILIDPGANGRPVSNDGQFIFFETSEALEPDDVNRAPDVYEWHNGLTSLISDGVDPGTSGDLQDSNANLFLGSSADGRDVFFQTPDTLVAEGGENPTVVYDARIGGGFPLPIVPPPCREDACQGTISPTPSFPSPSSALYNSGGNVTTPIIKATVKSKAKKKAKPKKSNKHTSRKKSGGHKNKTGKLTVKRGK